MEANFTPYGRGLAGPMTRQELGRVLVSMVCLGAQPNDEVTVFVQATTGDPAPWIEFSISDRNFGIWRNTGEVFEADEDGAMGEDAVL